MNLNNEQTGHVVITLYSMSGQKIGTLANEILLEGRYTFNINEALKNVPSAGLYIFRISSNSRTASGKLMLM